MRFLALFGNGFALRFRRLAHTLSGENKLVPIHSTTRKYCHHSPPFCCFFPEPFGRPPSLPHSRILRLNFCLPHFLIRASALRRPMRLAALLAASGCLRFIFR